MTTRKYNPGFLTDDELVASFCVRTHEFASVVEMLRECTGSSNTHQIVIGPRGSGKTSLLLRIAAEVRRDAELRSNFFPIVFAEESYEVATAGEFWLESLSRLAAQAPRGNGSPDLCRTFDDLRTIRDDRTLGDRCLGALQDYSDREGKRLVLMVENLNMMFRDMSDPDAGWRLRHTLQTEPRIVLLASATNRFDEIDDPEHALYEQLRVILLRPLDTNECAVLWETVSGVCPPPEKIRALEILTGGNPRLLTIVARFGGELSFHKLMANVLDLVDDHTEYFKSHLESLPAQERRVYLALAALWKPATTREISDHARMETSKCSAQLTRLIGRGVVQSAGGSARRKQYYLTERLYNIYYLLRRSRRSDRLVEALIHFMESYYSPPELKDIGARIIREAESFSAEMQSLSQAALFRLIELPAVAEHREELLAMISEGFAVFPGRDSVPADVARAAETLMKPDEPGVDRPHERTDEEEERAARELFGVASALNDQDQAEDALAAYGEVVRRFGESESPAVLELAAMALFKKGLVLGELNKVADAFAAYDEVVRRFGENESLTVLQWIAPAMVMKGFALQRLNRAVDALAVYDEVVRRFGKDENSTLVESVAKALVSRGLMLQRLDRLDEALATYDEVVRRFGENNAQILVRCVAEALVNKGLILQRLNQATDALAACDEVVRRFGENKIPAVLRWVATALVNKGLALQRLSRSDDALAAYDEVARQFGDGKTTLFVGQVATALVGKGDLLSGMDRPHDALAVYDEVVRRFGEDETPILVQQTAKALIIKGLILQGLDRTDDALAACNEVVRRYGEDETPVLVQRVAMALVTKGLVLQQLNRTDDALAAYDEVVCRFDEDETPLLVQEAVIALISKGATLAGLNRQRDSLVVYDEVVRRFGESEVPVLHWWVEEALLRKADIELECRLYEAAAKTAGRILDQLQPASPEKRVRGHLIRARATLAGGDRSACERDVKTALALLPEIDPLPRESLSTLMVLGVVMWPEHMCELIKTSPSANLLLPLTTALELELGLDPRVAREVKEVAEDIRRDLARFKETGSYEIRERKGDEPYGRGAGAEGCLTRV